MNGVQLYEGWNYNVQYGGQTQLITYAIANITNLVRRIWVYRNGEWLMYDPYDPYGTDLHELRHGELANILMLADAFWEWDVEDPTPPPDLPPLCEIAGQITVVKEAYPAEYVVNQTVAIQNKGGPGRCRIYVRDMSPNASFTFESMELGADQMGYPRLAILMPSTGTEFSFRVTGESYKNGSWVVDSQTPKFTVKSLTPTTPPYEPPDDEEPKAGISMLHLAGLAAGGVLVLAVLTRKDRRA